MDTGAGIDSDGWLELKEDPGVWIQNNPDSHLLVRSLRLMQYDVEEIGDSIGLLTQLIRLDFDCCTSLKSVPNTITKLQNLKHLNFCMCYNLEELPPNMGHMVSLTHLFLSQCCNIKLLPDSITNLSNLTCLSLNSCDSLVGLPANIGNLASLTDLHLSNCHKLKSFPVGVANLSKLNSLSFKSCNFLTEIPPSDLGDLNKSLTHFSVPSGWKELPTSVCLLGSLIHLSLYKCYHMKSLPTSIVFLSKLKCLYLSFCKSLTDLPSNLGQLKSLSRLELSYCDKIKSLPDSMRDLCYLDTLLIEYCNSLQLLPVNLNVLDLKLNCCCNLNIPTGFFKLKHLHISVCTCSHQSFLNLKDSVSLQQLAISSCSRHYNETIIFPASSNQLVHLQILSLKDVCFVELPIFLVGLNQLSLVDIQQSKIKCLPWSITNLCKLRHLMLPTKFRLQTLPYHMIDSVIISVQLGHVRKSWKQLREEIWPSFFPQVRVDTAMYAPQHSSIITPPGYLRLKGDPGSWIQSNYESVKLVQMLELEDVDKSKNYSLGKMTQLNVTHLYISECRCFPENYFAMYTRLRHLSFEYCDKKSLFRSLSNDSLSKLSNLETLHIDLNDFIPPANINFPGNLKCISMAHANMKSLHDSLARLQNLKNIDLYECRYLNFFPANLYFAKVRLIDCSIKSLPTGLHHLEILCHCNFNGCNCPSKVGELNGLNKLTNLKTLSITCYQMKFIPSLAGLCNLENLQLKDCFSLKELPSYLGELVSLCNLDVSGTRIKSLPGSIMKLHLQDLILPMCFNLENLPRNFAEVSIIDNTHETYYKSNDYYKSRFETSTEFSVAKDIAQGYIQTQGRDIVPVAGVDETVSAEQITVNDINIDLTMEQFELITSEQSAISQVHKGFQFNARKDQINENSQYVACSSQNQIPSSGNDDFVTTFDDEITTDQRFTTVTSENEQLPTKFIAEKILDGNRLKYDCCIQSLPTDLINTDYLDIPLCVCSEELLAKLKYSQSLHHLAIKDCKQQHHVIELPANLNEFVNLQTLFIQCSYIESLPSFVGLRNLQKLYLGGDGASRLEEFPADLDKLDELLAIDIHDTKIKCLPWSLMKLQKLRFLFLPLDFRLETLPYQLNESVVITVDSMHIRKIWKELRNEMRPSSIHGIMETSRSSCIFSHSGYLRMKEDPKQWIKLNIDSCESVQSLELELSDNMEKIGQSIWKLSKLTYLYISGSYCLHLKHLPDTSMTLRHLSLQNCNIKSFPDSLGKLSNLEFLCLDLQNLNLPDNLDLLVNLGHLSLFHGKEQSDFDNIAKLYNLKALDLFQCELECLPEKLNLSELKLSGTNIRSLPTSLHSLEILHDKGRCESAECDLTSLNLKQLINMEKLSVTCYSMELLPSIESLQNLQELQLKDCSSLEELPNDLGALVKLCTLDISGTRIKSLPDSITKLQNLILPTGFQQDCSYKYPEKEFNKVSVDNTAELYFNDKSYDYETSMETSDEGNERELDSINEYNEAISKEVEEDTINAQSSLQKLHVTPNLGDFCYNIAENSNHEGPAIRNGEGNHHASVNGQKQNQILQTDMKGLKNRFKISKNMLQSFWSKNVTLEKAAEKLRVSRSTMKRRMKDFNLVWPSSRKGKQNHDAKYKKHNNKAPFVSDFSLQNLVNSSNSAVNTKNVGECIMAPDQLTLPNHVSSFNVVNMNSKIRMETNKKNLMETLGDMDSPRHAEEDGVIERTLENTMQQNENLSKFTVKATYKEDTIKFEFSLGCSIDQLKEEVANQLELEANTFKIKYQDEDKDWILITRMSNLEDALKFSRSHNTSVVRLLIDPKT